ncbi:MAG: alpha/beta hydrolase [Christensenellaceae bacterium]
MKIDGLNINYEIDGAGKDVLILHGWGANIDTVRPIINGLKATKRVIAFDFAGFGKSDVPKKDLTVQDYMEMTVDFMHRLGLSKTDIICHSFGGRVTILLAAKYPELVGKIVFCDAAGVRKKRTLAYYAKIGGYKLCKKIAKVRWLKKCANALGVDVDKRIKNAGSADYKDLPMEMKKTFINVVNEDLKKYLKKISAPSLLIWGENDLDTPVYMGKIFENEIKDAGLVVLKNAGHYAYLDQYAQFMAIINQFLGK